MRRYSNFGDQGKRLRRLADLPVRATSEVTEEPARLRVILSAADKQQLVESYVAGSTIRELARRFAVNRETVSKILAERGVERRYHQTGTVDMERAAALEAEGRTVTEIAAELGVGRTTLVRARRASRLQ